MADKSKGKIVVNSPVILGFSAVCLVSLLLNILTHGRTNELFFSVYRSSLLNPLTYLRFFGHACGHANWSLFFGNMTLLLILGPLLEEKYGKGDIALVMVVTALVTGLVNFIFFPHVALLGASGIVFAFILLSSFTGVKEGKIPLTFILVAVIYIGQQVYDGIFLKDNISNLAHIVGGIVGCVFGFAENKIRR